MGAGVVTVGRRQYAVGLYWENSPSGRLAQTAKEAARQPGQQAEFYALRSGAKNGRVPQFGLGQSAAGHKAGMPAFAACLANQQPGSWAGAFRLREGIVVTVVRDDLVVPDGDQFFVNEHEARDRLLQEVGFGGLQRIYAPEAWSISGADSMPVSLLLDERRDVRLRPVEIPKKMILIGALAAGLLLVVLAGGWYYNEKMAEEEAAQQAQRDALRRLQSQANKANPFQKAGPEYPPPERKWEKTPHPLEVIESCRAGLAEIPATVVGWRMTTLKCDGRQITVTLSHDKGYAPPPPHATVNDTGLGATMTVPLPALNPRGRENLTDPSEITKRFLTQNWPGTVNRVADDPPPPPPAGYQGAWLPPPAPWVKRSFTVKVPELPASLADYFGDLPGAIIESVSFSGSGGNAAWTVDGVIYENRI